MGYPPNQSYPEYQNPEFYQPKYPPNYSNNYPSYPSNPHQTYPPEPGDHLSTWSNEDRQTLNNPYYPDHTCPDQPQYQPHPRQSSEVTSRENHRVNSVEGEGEGVIALQWNVQSCTRPETELVMKVQHTYEEHQSDLDNIIRQLALLTEIMGEMKKNGAESEVYGDDEEERGTGEAEKEGPDEAKKRVKAVKIQPGGEETAAEEESVVTDPNDHEQREFPEWARDEVARKGDVNVRDDTELNHALSYLRGKETRTPDRGAEESLVGKKGTVSNGNTPVGELLPEIDGSREYHRNEEKQG